MLFDSQVNALQLVEWEWLVPWQESNRRFPGDRIDSDPFYGRDEELDDDKEDDDFDEDFDDEDFDDEDLEDEDFDDEDGFEDDLDEDDEGIC